MNRENRLGIALQDLLEKIEGEAMVQKEPGRYYVFVNDLYDEIKEARRALHGWRPTNED